MTPELITALAGATTGAAAFITAAVMYRKTRTQRELLEFVAQQVGDFDDQLRRQKELIETSGQRINEQQRRIAWLESRVRNPKLLTEDAVLPEQSEPAKMTMTERRHRVAKLAARGQSVETIAATLGMLPGEVELIVNLSASAATSGGASR
jgi:DNA-binding NarL/FixJ family response regulator